MKFYNIHILSGGFLLIQVPIHSPYTLLIPYTFLTESMVPPLWYKSDSLANVPSWHILTSFKSSWTIMWYLFNMPANVNLLLYPALSSPTFLSHPNTGLSLSSIVKAYSLGTFICHTTDILNCCLCEIVQWIKPPFLLFPNCCISFGLIIWYHSGLYLSTLFLIFIYLILLFIYIFTIFWFLHLFLAIHTTLSYLIVNLLFHIVDKLLIIPYTTHE